MSTIITLQSSDLISSSRADINTSLSNLNTDKEEVSNKDTDGTLAANSDTKYASQKATKTYVDTQTTSASAKTKISVVYGQLIAAGDALYMKAGDQKAWKTDSDAVDTTNPFIGFALEAGNADETHLVQINGIVTGLSGLTAGTEYYIGSTAGAIQSTAGTNALKVGIALSTTTLLINKTPNQHPKITTYLTAASPATWTKPVGLKYIEVEVQAGGGGGGSADGAGYNAGNGGGGGGYSRKIIQASALGATETVTIGAGGAGGAGGGSGNDGASGGTSSFGSHLSATGGAGGVFSNASGVIRSRSSGGSGSSGDINIGGSSGNYGYTVGTAITAVTSGEGGDSFMGKGGKKGETSLIQGQGGGLYGGGGAGAIQGWGGTGHDGAAGIVIVKEFF